MGLLNHLFKSKKNLAINLVMDDKKRMDLWLKHVSNFATINYLSQKFSFSEIDRALQNFQNIKEALTKIESLISPELVSIGEEEKSEDDILKDLEELKGAEDAKKLSDDLIHEIHKQETIRKIFHEIYKNWIIVLHLIRLIRKNPPNIRILLLELKKIIVKNAYLYSPFMKESYYEENQEIHQEIIRLAKAVIFNEGIKEEIKKEESDEERLAKEILKQMVPDETKNKYRKLGEAIFLKLANKAGAPLPRGGEEIIEGIKRMEDFMKNDEIMYKIVKSLRTKYNETEIRAVILAFRKAYSSLYFEDLESEFVT